MSAGDAQVSAYTPTSLHESFDFNMPLAQSTYDNVSNNTQDSRATSIKQSKRSTGSQSNRASLGLVNTSGYESAGYAHSTGHVTPDSITTSGAATPYTFPHESRSTQLSPSEPHATNGELGYGATSRPLTSSGYIHQHTPQIIGHDWPSNAPYNAIDDYGASHHHSGTNTPLHRDKSNPDFSNMPLSGYAYFHPKI